LVFGAGLYAAGFRRRRNLLLAILAGGDLGRRMAKTAKLKATDPLRARRDEEKEERRQAIIDAAEHVIAKVGWAATNFGEIAKRARLSRSLVYFYFPDRDDLFHAVCGRGLAMMEQRFAAAMAAHRMGLDQMMAIGEAYYRFSLDEPLYFAVLSDYQARDSDPETETENEAAAHAHGRACLGMVAQALANGLADGSIRKSIGDPRPTAVSVWAFTHGLIQIAARKEAMLRQDFGLTSAKAMAHGFSLLRGSLSAR
jgi:AcrR family transcriptional regulator